MELLETFLKKLKHDVASTGQKFDVILVPGDFVAHGISIDPTDPSAEGDYTLLK